MLFDSDWTKSLNRVKQSLRAGLQKVKIKFFSLFFIFLLAIRFRLWYKGAVSKGFGWFCLVAFEV